MKKTLKLKTLIALIVLAVVVGISSISNAYSVGASLSSGDKLVAGESVNVTLSLSDIDADTGVTAITVNKVSYDTNVFETITADSFKGANGWTPSYSTNSQALTLTNNTHIKDASAAVTLTLKVKAGITATSATVKFEGIVASAGLTTGDIDVGTKTITVKAEEKAETGSENTQNTNTIAPTQNTTKSNSTTTSTINQTTTTSTKANLSNLPKAGISSGIIFVVAIGAVAGVIFYVKYRNIKKYDK